MLQFCKKKKESEKANKFLVLFEKRLLIQKTSQRSLRNYPGTHFENTTFNDILLKVAMFTVRVWTVYIYGEDKAGTGTKI